MFHAVRPKKRQQPDSEEEKEEAAELPSDSETDQDADTAPAFSLPSKRQLTQAGGRAAQTSRPKRACTVKGTKAAGHAAGQAAAHRATSDSASDTVEERLSSLERSTPESELDIGTEVRQAHESSPHADITCGRSDMNTCWQG